MTRRTGRKNQLIERPRARYSRDSSSCGSFKFSLEYVVLEGAERRLASFGTNSHRITSEKVSGLFRLSYVCIRVVSRRMEANSILLGIKYIIRIYMIVVYVQYAYPKDVQKISRRYL